MKTLFVAAALALTALSAAADEAIELPGGSYMIAYQDGAGVACHIEDGCAFWKDLSLVHQTKIVEIIATQEALDFIAYRRLSGKAYPTWGDYQKMLSADWTNHFYDLYAAANKHRTTF
ncbi:MAG: hypothetical protein OSB62_02420 [Alphaproteobacteria bacterium]|nr:hypothetical protein [Alphaproteobacteria bacterium]